MADTFTARSSCPWLCSEKRTSCRLDPMALTAHSPPAPPALAQPSCGRGCSERQSGLCGSSFGKKAPIMVPAAARTSRALTRVPRPRPTCRLAARPSRRRLLQQNRRIALSCRLPTCSTGCHCNWPTAPRPELSRTCGNGGGSVASDWRWCPPTALPPTADDSVCGSVQPGRHANLTSRWHSLRLASPRPLSSRGSTRRRGCSPSRSTAAPAASGSVVASRC
mmetsp:Transcript_10865/g.35942  ORF Transcript_10865/g.35942 Transcript_10865/m.35942 type:complete len:222 (+) Transcript_10865:378-1043(+)